MYRLSLLCNILKYDFMKDRHRLLYYRVAPIYIRYTLYTTKKNLQVRTLYHSRDRIVDASRPLQIYTESANPIAFQSFNVECT